MFNQSSRNRNNGKKTPHQIKSNRNSNHPMRFVSKNVIYRTTLNQYEY